jgi:hypothetical protein
MAFPSLDKSAFSTRRSSDPPDDRDYGSSKSPEKPLEAIEILRQIIYGYNPATTRLQNVLDVIHRETS